MKLTSIVTRNGIL